MHTLSDTLFKTDGALHLQQSLILPASNHLDGNFAVRIMYGSVCCCSSPDQSPVAIQHSWFFYCASLFDHYPLQLCCKKKNPRGLLHCLTFKCAGEKGKKRWNIPISMCGRLSSIGGCQIKESKRATIPVSPPLGCTRCLCPWKPTVSPTLKLVKVCLFLKSSGSAQHQSISSAGGYLRG